jgi:Raf kinase inhibitor-like YbhB/YbcL family protein
MVMGGAMMRKVGLVFVTLLLVTSFVMAGCAQPATPEEKLLPESAEVSLTLSSNAFVTGENIPVTYTCDGQNISPPLAWSQGPAGTASFALILEDPDAPVKNFTHWVIYNLPPDGRSLAEAVTQDAELASGAIQGKNGLGRIGYTGPCPPKGSPHHYNFTLYALDKSLDLGAEATKDQVLQAVKGHILAQAQLVGLYQR